MENRIKVCIFESNKVVFAHWMRFNTELLKYTLYFSNTCSLTHFNNNKTLQIIDYLPNNFKWHEFWSFSAASNYLLICPHYSNLITIRRSRVYGKYLLNILRHSLAKNHENALLNPEKKRYDYYSILVFSMINNCQYSEIDKIPLPWILVL